ncbi:MAG: hypothetical protein U0790_04055 [Isosphaeraceae bacterium]
MLENTFADIARKAQHVATKVALAASKLADRLAQRVARREARARARAEARVEARAQRDFLRTVARRPMVTLVREVRHGQTSVSIFRSHDHRTGRVREYWTINRETSRGRVRLAAGSMSELRSLTRVVKQATREHRHTSARARERRAGRASNQNGHARDFNSMVDQFLTNAHGARSLGR